MANRLKMTPTNMSAFLEALGKTTSVLRASKSVQRPRRSFLVGGGRLIRMKGLDRRDTEQRMRMLAALLSIKPNLPPGALRLLTLLCVRAGEVVTYDEARQVIGGRAADFRRVARVWMMKIRDRLPRGCEIKAVRGQGYRLQQRLTT